MTGQQALNMIMARLNRTHPTLRANALLEMIQYQQITLEKGEVLPEFLIRYDQTIALIAGNRQFAMPTGFLRELDEDETLWILDDQGAYHPMTKVGWDDAEFTRDATGDFPLKYVSRGGFGYTLPAPTVNRTLKMDCYVADDAPTDTSATNLWLTHASDILVGGAGAIVNALYVKDLEAAGFFAAMESRGRQRLLNDATAAQEAGRARRMG